MAGVVKSVETGRLPVGSVGAVVSEPGNELMGSTEGIGVDSVEVVSFANGGRTMGECVGVVVFDDTDKLGIGSSEDVEFGDIGGIAVGSADDVESEGSVVDVLAGGPEISGGRPVVLVKGGSGDVVGVTGVVVFENGRLVVSVGGVVVAFAEGGAIMNVLVELDGTSVVLEGGIVGSLVVTVELTKGGAVTVNVSDEPDGTWVVVVMSGTAELVMLPAASDAVGAATVVFDRGREVDGTGSVVFTGTVDDVSGRETVVFVRGDVEGSIVVEPVGIDSEGPGTDVVLVNGAENEASGVVEFPGAGDVDTAGAVVLLVRSGDGEGKPMDTVEFGNKVETEGSIDIVEFGNKVETEGSIVAVSVGTDKVDGTKTVVFVNDVDRDGSVDIVKFGNNVETEGSIVTTVSAGTDEVDQVDGTKTVVFVKDEGSTDTVEFAKDVETGGSTVVAVSIKTDEVDGTKTVVFENDVDREGSANTVEFGNNVETEGSIVTVSTGTDEVDGTKTVVFVKDGSNDGPKTVEFSGCSEVDVTTIVVDTVEPIDHGGSEGVVAFGNPEEMASESPVLTLLGTDMVDQVLSGGKAADEFANRVDELELVYVGLLMLVSLVDTWLDVAFDNGGGKSVVSDGTRVDVSATELLVNTGDVVVASITVGATVGPSSEVDVSGRLGSEDVPGAVALAGPVLEVPLEGVATGGAIITIPVDDEVLLTGSEDVPGAVALAGPVLEVSSLEGVATGGAIMIIPVDDEVLMTGSGDVPGAVVFPGPMLEVS